ncbi:aromatic-ring-hydroxylating dioxygenase subunit beta [Dactylosporangium salmoneum]|uniref:3-phenylpropionate/cinnamic acid dioxygenase subunit beta n=1 Tax=Dactylosporangium salmoneum TaxID=53361 RepID=A0ABP5TSG7_9ACTN
MTAMSLPMADQKPLSVASVEYVEATDFLLLEAELLDDLREREWLETMVSKDVVYQLPIRETVERARGRGFIEGTFHLNENYGSLSSKVARNETKYAWAEDPPSRLRHFVTNVRVRRHGDADKLAVRSNVLIYRTRQDHTVPQILAGERHDVLRREEDGLRLLERVVYLDLTVIGTHNLSLFF